MSLPLPCRATGLAALLLCGTLPVHAAERITLTNGFDMVCDHTISQGDQTLLYMDAGAANYIAVSTGEIAATTAIASPSGSLAAARVLVSPASRSPRQQAQTHAALSEDEVGQLLLGAGHAHDLNVDLLMSVVDAESARHVDARSRVGAEGLMQLMPATAKQLGVQDAFAPGENVQGGTAYLDALLRRYHDNLALALAAYNAGPAAVDHWRGIPPYRETRAYVARIIHEFNRRYAARQALALKGPRETF